MLVYNQYNFIIEFYNYMKFFLDKIVRIGFDLGLIFKAIDSLFEIIVSIALMFLSPVKMNHIIYIITKDDIYEHKTDFLVNYLIAFGHRFSSSTQKFAVFFLLTHGIVKMIVVILLWKKLLWAYHISVIVLAFFIVYQIKRYTVTHSIMLIFLSALDIFMIVFTVLEYRRINSKVY